MEHLDGSGCGRVYRQGSCTIITTTPDALIETIHGRMPVILSPEERAAWLDPKPREDEALLSLLKPFDAEQMQTWPVSRAVEKVANQGEGLILPLTQ